MWETTVLFMRNLQYQICKYNLQLKNLFHKMFEVPSWDDVDAFQEDLAKKLFNDQTPETNQPRDYELRKNEIDASGIPETHKRKKKKEKQICKSAKEKHVSTTGERSSKDVDTIKNDTVSKKSKRKRKLITSDENEQESKKQGSKTKKELKRLKKKSNANNEASNLIDLVSSSVHDFADGSISQHKEIEKSEQSVSKCIEITKANKINSSSVSLKEKLKRKLAGAQFRWINEQLYTVESDNAWEMFKEDPSLFDVYHHGFQSQVESWPENPVDVIIRQLKKSKEDIVVADLGCGEAKIAQSVKQKVYSFDFVAKNDFVVSADISKVPLSRGSVDIAIFCLSLMGINLSEFLKEAKRILKSNGVLKIAEVTSRFDNIDDFVENICKMGFTLIEKDESNKMFVIMDFVKKEDGKESQNADIKLKPCIYKRR